MIYYFLNYDGDDVTVEEAPKGWFQRSCDCFTNKRELEAEQKRRLKSRIAELEECLLELKLK